MALGLSLCNVLEEIIDSEDEISDFSDIFDEDKLYLQLWWNDNPWLYTTVLRVFWWLGKFDLSPLYKRELTTKDSFKTASDIQYEYHETVTLTIDGENVVNFQDGRK